MKTISKYLISALAVLLTGISYSYYIAHITSNKKAILLGAIATLFVLGFCMLCNLIYFIPKLHKAISYISPGIISIGVVLGLNHANLLEWDFFDSLVFANLAIGVFWYLLAYLSLKQSKSND